MDATQAQSALEAILMVVVPKIIGAMLLLFVAWIVAKWLGKRVTKTIGLKLDQTIASFMGSLVKYAILSMALLGCLRIFGIETTSFVALIGAAGLAIGLALQGTLTNFSSGVMLLLFRPFKVGDVISAGGVTAKVAEIGMFTTQLDTADNRRMIVPNGDIYGSAIENITFHETRRVDVSVGTEYSANIGETRKVLLEAVTGIEGVLATPEPVAMLTELGGSSIDWSVRVWANTPDYWAVREKVTQAVKDTLDKAGIGIPFPQMDVHLDGIEFSED
jgi:small conductance mechanosensitive channel